MVAQSHPRLVAAFRVFSVVASALVVLTGGLVIWGWAADLPALKALYAGLVPMNPAAALCFVLAGGAILLRRREDADRFSRAAAQCFSLIVAVTGAACLAGNLLQFNPFLDSLLFAEKLVKAGPYLATRIPANTALGLLLVGAALLLLDRETARGRRPAQLLLLGAALICLLTIATFVYRAAAFTPWSLLAPMALSTALALTLVTLAAITARPDRGLMAVVTSHTAGGLTARQLSLAGLVVPWGLGWLWLAGQRQRWFDAPQGAAVLVVANIIVFLAVVWWNARSADHMDEARESTEEQLRDSEAMYHSLVENLPECIYRKDLQGRFMFVNSRFCDLLGKPRREILGKTDYDFYPMGLAEQYEAADKKVIETSAPFETVEERKGADGEKAYYQMTKTPLLDSKKRIIGVQGVFYDITARVRAEQALMHERYLLHTLMDNFPDQIYFKDHDSRYIRINKALAEKHGLPDPSAADGKTDFDFFAQEYALQSFSDEREVMRSGHPIVGKEEKETWTGGQCTWVSTTKMPLKDMHGKIIGSFGISRDITERKQFVEQLQKNNDDLARSEAALRQAMSDLQRTHEELKKAQAQLIQAEKMESVGTLAAGVAHEVKNPLAILRMGIDFMASTPAAADENGRMVIDEMKDAIDRADNIIRGLLDFSASREIAVEEDNLNTVIDCSLNLVRHELGKRGIVVRRELAEDLPPIRVDKNQLQQVFLNLFMNAAQAMGDQGTLTIRTYAKVLTDGGHEAGTRQAGRFWVNDEVVMAEVDDTGPGIPGEFLSKIFDPFFTTKANGEGTGLGLPVSKKIVEMHDGALEIMNLPERGARASIMLKARARELV
jgi:PAS domain S-box-containing protein